VHTDRDGLSEEPGFNFRVGREISCSDSRGEYVEINFSGSQIGSTVTFIICDSQ